MLDNQRKIKIVFWGTPEFSKIILKKLLNDDRYEVAAVVTTPDKPIGRKQILTPSLVKILVQEKNILVLQPEKLDEEFIGQLKKIQADVFVVASYGKIIPQAVLDIPKFGNINVHPSLLPKYRGPSPIQTAILNGDSETGVTIMLMDEKMDHGDILKSVQYPVSSVKVFKDLHNELAEVGGELLINTISDYVNEKIQPQEQNHEQATFCKMIKKQDGEINWKKSAQEIYNQWRAFQDWPGIFSQSTINNQQLTIKLIEVSLSVPTSEVGVPTEKIGKWFVEDKKLFIMCGQKSVLEIKQLQPQGKKIMNAQAFINGYLKQHSKYN